MTGGRRLASIRRVWPSFHAVVTDLGRTTEIPDESDIEALASADGPTVLAGLGLSTSGMGLAEVWLGQAPGDLECLDSCYFYSHSGAVVLGDIFYGRLSLARIGRGTHVLRILVDDIEKTGHLVFEFTPYVCEMPSSPDRRRTLGRQHHRRAQRRWDGHPSHAGSPLGVPHTMPPEVPEAPEYPKELLDLMFPEGGDDSEDWEDPEDPEDRHS